MDRRKVADTYIEIGEGTTLLVRTKFGEVLIKAGLNNVNESEPIRVEVEGRHYSEMKSFIENNGDANEKAVVVTSFLKGRE